MSLADLDNIKKRCIERLFLIIKCNRQAHSLQSMMLNLKCWLTLETMIVQKVSEKIIIN